MDPVAVVIGVSWILTAVVIAGLSVPLLRGRVPRNAFYGARFPASFRSEEAWLAINRYAAKRMIAWSLPLLAVGAAALFLPLSSRLAVALFFGFAPLLFIVIPLLQTWRFSRPHVPGA